MGKKQHYVPQFYMKKFSSNQKSIGLYIFNQEKYIENASIKDINLKHYFYGENNANEKLLSELEGKWNTIISEIIKTSTIPKHEKDYIYLCMLLMVSYGRTLAATEELEKALKNLVDIMAELSLDVYPNTKKQEYDVSFEGMSSVLLKASIGMTPIICDLIPVLIINKTKHDFITSDTPLCSYNQLFVSKKHRYAYGFGQIGLQLFFPISPRICLCLYDSAVYKVKIGVDGNIQVNNKRYINEINKLLTLNADKLIMFNNSCDKRLVKKYAKYKRCHEKILTGGIAKSYDADGEYLGKAAIWAIKSVYEKIKLRYFRINREYLRLQLSQSPKLTRPQAEKFLQDRNPLESLFD